MKNKVKRQSLADQIVSDLRKDIFTGVYQPGQKLPIERELAEQFGTSLGTLKKAIQILSQEGWIETVQGRGNTVCDFRNKVKIDVIPELLQDCPEAIFKPQFLDFWVDFIAFIYCHMYLAAAENATPEDEPRLMELMLAQKEGTTVLEFWENDRRYYGELLRIGDNMLLQMSYNLMITTTFKLVESGIFCNLPHPIPVYREMNRNLIKAVCAGDRNKVSELMESYKRYEVDSYRNLILEVSDYSEKRS
jgi:DNA-binding FadR family transcriptional regulator